MANPTKNFESAIREEGAEEEQLPLSFKINGQGYGEDGKNSFEGFTPTAEQTALFMASIGRDSGQADSVSGMMEFLRSTLDDISFRNLRAQLADSDHPLRLYDMQQIVAWMIEESSARPTKPRSGSTGSRRTTGTTSTRASRSRG